MSQANLLTETTYTPSSQTNTGWVASWRATVVNIYKFRGLLWQLFKRDFLSSYKKSFLGYIWMLINPLVGILSWVIMYSAGILRPGEVQVPYPVYVLVGTTMWGFWVGLYQSASTTLQSGSSLLQQVKYPHEILLAKQLSQHIVQWCISLICILLVVVVFRVIPHPMTVLLPIVLLPALFLGVALGLMSSMITVVLPDVTQMFNIGIGFLIFLSPIIYGPEAHGSHLLKRINDVNPMTHIVCSARDIVLYGRLYDLQGWLVVLGVSFVLFMIALRLFYVAEQRLVERMM